MSYDAPEICAQSVRNCCAKWLSAYSIKGIFLHQVCIIHKDQIKYTKHIKIQTKQDFIYIFIFDILIFIFLFLNAAQVLGPFKVIQTCLHVFTIINTCSYCIVFIHDIIYINNEA